METLNEKFDRLFDKVLFIDMDNETRVVLRFKPRVKGAPREVVTSTEVWEYAAARYKTVEKPEAESFVKSNRAGDIEFRFLKTKKVKKPKKVLDKPKKAPKEEKTDEV